MKYFNKIISYTSLSLFFLIVFTASSSAQEEEKVDKGITISPLIIEYDVDPGETVSGQIRISNSTLSDKTIFVYVENFQSDGVSGVPVFNTQDLPYEASLKEWISLEQTSFFVQRAEDSEDKSALVNFSITIPQNAEPGGHYAGIISTLQNPDDRQAPGAGNLSFSSDQGTLILLNVSGDVQRDISIDKFYSSSPFDADQKKKSIFDWMPVGLVVELNNTGNSHTTPLGSIIIYKGDSKVDELEFNTNEGKILKDSSRVFVNEFSEGFIKYSPVLDENDNPIKKENGDIDKKLTFESGQGLFAFGKYRAELTVGYQDGDEYKSVMAETSFWVIPWKLILILIAIISAYIWFKIKKKK